MDKCDFTEIDTKNGKISTDNSIIEKAIAIFISSVAIKIIGSLFKKQKDE